MLRGCEIKPSIFGKFTSIITINVNKYCQLAMNCECVELSHTLQLETNVRRGVDRLRESESMDSCPPTQRPGRAQDQGPVQAVEDYHANI